MSYNLGKYTDLGYHHTTYTYIESCLLKTERSDLGKQIDYLYEGNGTLSEYHDLTHEETVNFTYNDEGLLSLRESSRGGNDSSWLREFDYYEYDTLSKNISPFFNTTSAVQTMETNAATQGLSMATQQQEHFDWRQFGISTLTTGVLSGEISHELQETLRKISFNTGILNEELNAVAEAGTTSVLTKKAFNPVKTVTDNLGNAIGGEITHSGAPATLRDEEMDNFYYTDSVLDVLHPERLDEKIDGRFEQIMGHVFPNEGGISNHKNDRGGYTNMGITFDTYKQVAKQEDFTATRGSLSKLTRSRAQEIYKKYFWNVIKADEINSFSIAHTFLTSI